MMNKDCDIVFKRKMFFGERLMHVYDRGSLILNMTLVIKGCIEEKNIVMSLDKLQKKHPQLRMCVKDEWFIIREKVNPIPLKIVQRKASDTWRDELEKELAIPFDYDKGPLMRVIWVKSDEFSEIIVLAPHTIMDGKSFFSLTKELCLFMDDPDREANIYSPITSLNDLLPDVSLSWKDKMFARLLVFPANILLYLSTLGKKEEPIEYNYIYWNLDIGKVKILKAMVEERNVQLGALISVLMSRAFMNHYRCNKKKRLIFMSLDMRRYIRTIKKDMLFSFAPMLRLNVKFDKYPDFWKLAKDLGDDIVDKALKKSTIKRTFVQYPITKGTLFTEYLHGLLKMLIRRNLRLDTGQDFNFINTGIVKFPLKNNSFEVENVVGENRMPWKNPNIFYLVDYRELHFHIVSNNNLIPKEKIEDIKNEFNKMLNDLISQR